MHLRAEEFTRRANAEYGIEVDAEFPEGTKRAEDAADAVRVIRPLV